MQYRQLSNSRPNHLVAVRAATQYTSSEIGEMTREHATKACFACHLPFSRLNAPITGDFTPLPLLL